MFKLDSRSLTTGVSTKACLEGTNQTQSGPYGKLEMKVPLYSKQERIAINKYYDIQVEIVKEQEGVAEAKKKFDAMLIGP